MLNKNIEDFINLSVKSGNFYLNSASADLGNGIITANIYIDMKSVGNKNSTPIEKVIFNKPATVVYWEDGSRTVVKLGAGEKWDKEKGLGMAISKKFFGNKGNYNEVFKTYIEELK